MRTVVLLLVALLLIPIGSEAALRRDIGETTLKKDWHLTRYDQKVVQRIAKRTTLVPEDIARYLDSGLGEQGIYDCYVIWNLSTAEMDDIVDVYKNEDDLRFVLKDFDLTMEEFEEEYERVIMPEDSSNERVAPWRRTPH